MNTIHSLFLFAFCAFHLSSWSQTYQLTVDSKPFVYLENPQVAVEGPWNIAEFELPIGFDFEFFDFTSDHIYSYFNSFGGVYELNLDEDHLYVLIPFYASLIDRGYQQDSALSPIHYKTEGLPGQQVFTLEFKEAGLFEGFEDDNGIFHDYVSFQLRLYEENGDIEFHYGPYSTKEDPSVIFYPFPGPIVGLVGDIEWTNGSHIGELMLLEGNPLNPTVASDTVHTFLEAPIPENTVYRFSRNTTSVDEHIRFAKQPILYPNPTTGDLTLNEINTNDIIYPIIVTDALGMQVSLWKTESEISASSLSAGCYYVTVNVNGKVVTEKLVVLSN